MPFTYATRPGPGLDRFTSQPVYRGIRRADEVVAALAEATGAPDAQVAAVLEKLGEYVVRESMDGWRIEPLFDYLGFSGTCGGSHPAPDFAPTFDNLKMDIRMRLGRAARTLMREVFSAELKGHRDMVLPEVVRVLDTHTDELCCYTPGRPLQIDLKENYGTLDPSQSTQGVFFKAANGALVRATDYGYARGTLIICNVPAGLTGPQDLCVTMEVYGSVRTGVYARTLQPSGAQAEEEPPPSRSKKNGPKDLTLSA